VELNSILFQKTLVRKDVASSSSTNEDAKANDAAKKSDATSETKDEEDEFSSKAQIMTLMTTDVDRVSEFAWHLFTLVGMYSVFLMSVVISLYAFRFAY